MCECANEVEARRWRLFAPPALMIDTASAWGGQALRSRLPSVWNLTTNTPFLWSGAPADLGVNQSAHGSRGARLSAGAGRFTGWQASARYMPLLRSSLSLFDGLLYTCRPYGARPPLPPAFFTGGWARRVLPLQGKVPLISWPATELRPLWGRVSVKANQKGLWLCGLGAVLFICTSAYLLICTLFSVCSASSVRIWVIL